MILDRYPELKDSVKEADKAIETIIKSYEAGGKVLIAGNGGSASDSEHIAGELLKSFVKKRPISEEIKKSILEKTENKEDAVRLIENLEQPLMAIALTSHPSLTTAFINDKEPYLVFAQELLAFGKKGDVFIGISTSGNAKNIILAAELAKAIGVTVVSLTGENGGLLAKLADIAIKAPAKETYIVQEYHLPIYHYMCLKIEEHFFKENR